jgi:hypothetical protein
MSFSSDEPERKLLCQSWVDILGTYLDFTVSFEVGRMVVYLDGMGGGEPCKHRLVCYDFMAINFEWIWERSDDGGESWRILWQIHYTRK